MSIGETIKSLRLARKLTQEELASYLGITSKAVSQWECNRTSPDISQIPMLCKLFQVSADQLLNINVQGTDEKRKQILADAFKQSRKGHFQAAWEILQEGLAIFPNDYTIMMHLVICGESLGKITDREEKTEAVKEQCAHYCRRILRGCTEDLARHIAVSYLCTFYAEKGDIQKAEALVGKMPFMNMSQEFLFAKLYEGTKGKDADQRLKSLLVQHLIKRFDTNCRLDTGELLYSPEEIEALREKTISLLELLFEKGDFGFYCGGLAEIHEMCARYYASVGEVANALRYLDRAAVLAVDFVMLLQRTSFIHTSLLFRGMEEKTSNVFLNGNDDLATVILKKLDCKEYDGIRETDPFKKIITLLDSNAKRSL